MSVASQRSRRWKKMVMISTQSLPESDIDELRMTIIQFRALGYELDAVTLKDEKITVRGKKILGYFRLI